MKELKVAINDSETEEVKDSQDLCLWDKHTLYAQIGDKIAELATQDY